MRSIWRTGPWRDLPGEILRDIGLVCLADGMVGIAYGAIAVSDGFALWVPMLLSVLVFAGAAQFLFIGLVSAGGSPIAALVAGLLVNARHLPFGFAIGDALGHGRLRRLVGSHLMVDETVAFALAQDRADGLDDDARADRRRAVYWTCGLGLFVSWNTGVLIGGLAGTAVTDTDVLGLDAAFPAVLLALVLPSLRDRWTGLAALTAAAIALATTPFLPVGLPILLALLGLLVVRPWRVPA